ncbi:hypothetical protein L0U85_11575 [Glycomyces sp. L485]|uniref:hypothetical protein n=1 Tax=Glycomyces sp. L485 TaxID=2909235 RepID=UPI001F4B9312|nr:hypothetical protein [Glycomyces sp. L485]MCH7231485.1 hypothetical protein [Glycomyces sp. L485]
MLLRTTILPWLMGQSTWPDQAPLGMLTMADVETLSFSEVLVKGARLRSANGVSPLTPVHRFGKVRLWIGWLAWLMMAFAAVVLIMCIRALVIKPSISPLPMLAFALFIMLSWRRGLLLAPAVTTDPEGITLRTESGRSGIFVRWEHVEAVVIWYDSYGGHKTTMIGIRVPDGYRFDNEGKFPVVEPQDRPYPDTRVPEAIRKRSVRIAATRSRRIARLIRSSGMDVPVFEVPDRFFGVVRRLAGSGTWDQHR